MFVLYFSFICTKEIELFDGIGPYLVEGVFYLGL